MKTPQQAANPETVAERISLRVQQIERTLRRSNVPWESIHRECNVHLETLRSGSRRRHHSPLRDRIRRLRAIAAHGLP